jgi:predicted TIM-barrel fold metal-dependent hydrolase
MTLVDFNMWMGEGGAWGYVDAPSSPLGTTRRLKYEPRQVLDECDRAGIDIACVIPLRQVEYADANRMIADECARHPGRLVGIAVHSPQREQGRLRKLITEEVRSMGLKGVRSDGPPTRELLDVAGDLDIPVIYYPEARGVAQSYHMIAGAYPGVSFILPHLGGYGGSWNVHLEAIDIARRYPNVHIDTSAISVPPYLEMASKELPPERLLFASCGPHLDVRVAMESMRLLGLPRTAHELAMGGNALRLLKLKAG